MRIMRRDQKGDFMAIDLSKMPKLGFGLMRFPEKGGVIDHEQVCKMDDNLSTCL